MFPTPDQMFHDYIAEERAEKMNYLESRMEEYKKDALFRIGKIVDMFYVEAIARTIASGYENEDEAAIEIVNRLSLNDKHIASILDDADMMEDILNDEAIEEEPFNDYEE
jgi:hypothetical protein